MWNNWSQKGSNLQEIGPYNGKRKRIEKHMLRDIVRDTYDKQERKYANDRLAEIDAREQEERTEYLGRQIKPDNTTCDRTDKGEGDFKGFFEDYAKRMVIDVNNYNLAVRLYNVRKILKNFQEF